MQALRTASLRFRGNREKGAQALAGLKTALHRTLCIWIFGQTMWEAMVHTPPPPPLSRGLQRSTEDAAHAIHVTQRVPQTPHCATPVQIRVSGDCRVPPQKVLSDCHFAYL